MTIYEPVPFFNSMFAGLIASSAPCGYVNTLGATVIGVISGIIYCLCAKLVKKFEIDDPLEVTQTHFACGIWGVLSIGLLHTENGLFYVGKSEQLQAQFIYTVALLLWGALMGTLFFSAVNKFGRLRIDQIYEVIGIDLLTHSSKETIKQQQ